MNKKRQKRFTVNIPEYMWKIITKIHDESPSITKNGTMLTILEKGINWYQKKWKQEEKKAETVTPGKESAQPDQHQDLPQSDTTVDHEIIYNQILEHARDLQERNKENGYNEAMNYIAEMAKKNKITKGEYNIIQNIIIAHVRWIDHS